ncbi:MAG TPA: hypothetical protein VEW42_01575 [Candidatus Eisenbacteria bacterium]|nr:hypothetical protein [Candidatus Eisenbacteria bacterium]
MSGESLPRRIVRRVKEILDSKPGDTPIIRDEQGRPIRREGGRRHWVEWFSGLYDKDPRRLDNIWRERDEEGRPKTD